MDEKDLNEEQINQKLAEQEQSLDPVEVARNSSDAKWYALHTFTGYEYMVKDSLENVIVKYDLSRRIFDIVIPMEEVIEEKNGKRKVVTRKMMPAYVLVKMIYGDDIWHAVTRTRGITGFVGPQGRPLPLSDDEVARLKLEKIKVDVDIKTGDKIEIISGPLEKMVGSIISVDLNAQKVRANVTMFGREMPVDLELLQIRKI